MTATRPRLGHPDLFLRLWDAERMTPTLARHVLKLGWTAADESRMRELAARNTAGTISNAELHDLDAYLEVGLTLSILHSRAEGLEGAGGEGEP